MSRLADQTLSHCNSDSSALSAEDIELYLAQLQDWYVHEVDGIRRISRHYRFSNFTLAQQFASQVGDIAEQENHHPCICIEWGKASVSWWTHSISGLFINDFIMAARCDDLYSLSQSE